MVVGLVFFELTKAATKRLNVACLAGAYLA